MNAPTPIIKGHPITADWLNQLRDFAARNRIISGPGYKIKESSSGTALEIDKPKPAPSYTTPTSANPWQIFQWTPAAPADTSPATYWRNVRVHLGYVNGKTTDQAKFVHELDPALPTGSNAGSVYDIRVPASQSEYKIYGYVTYTRKPYCSQQEGSIEINHVKIVAGGDNWWSGHPGQYPSAGVFCFEIGTILTGVDSPANDPDFQKLEISQICTSDQTIYSQPILFVTLTQDNPDPNPGTKDSACDYTYQATDLCGKVLGVSLSPQNSRARILNAPTNVATDGTVFWDASGVLKLWDCNETLTQYSCPNTVGGGSA